MVVLLFEACTLSDIFKVPPLFVPLTQCFCEGKCSLIKMGKVHVALMRRMKTRKGLVVLTEKEALMRRMKTRKG